VDLDPVVPWLICTPRIWLLHTYIQAIDLERVSNATQWLLK
jgi:hypothetical protein